MCSANFLPIEDVSVCPIDGIEPTQGQRKTLTRVESELTTVKGRGPNSISRASAHMVYW